MSDPHEEFPYEVVCKNRDTGREEIVAMVKSPREAEWIRQNHEERFTNDQVFIRGGGQGGRLRHSER